MRKDSGFTLIELMVAIIIVSIVIAIAVPAWSRWVPSYRLKRATRDVLSSFQQAKLEAVRRNVNVAISFNPDPVNSCAIFVDDGNGGGTANDFTQNGGEILLNSFNMPNFVTLVSTTFTGNAAAFNSRGLPAKPAGGVANGRVTLNNTKGITREVRLSIAGNIRIQ